MAQASTDWRELIAADEAERFARYAQGFAELQQRKSARFGKGRALHRKQILGLPATFEVLGELPAQARHGVFARPGRYEAWVRLSNGGADLASDRKPDVRGFAIKLLGVNGAGALGEDTRSQDFLLINLETFAFPKSEEFVAFVLAAGQGGGKLIGHLLRRYGVLGTARTLLRLGKTIGRPFRGFAAESFFSAAPIACGPYAVRVRLVPAARAPASGKPDDWGAELLSQLEHGPLHYDLQLQFFVDETRTPIEDASVNWPEDLAPYATVGRLTLPARAQWAEQREALQGRIEAAVFDPWSALKEHRPLGDVMRARKVIYFESQRIRGART